MSLRWAGGRAEWRHLVGGEEKEALGRTEEDRGMNGWKEKGASTQK